MKRIIKFMVFFSVVTLSVFVSFDGYGQNATINGNICPLSPTICSSNVCENSVIALTAGISSGAIDSVRWFEQIDDGSGSGWGSANSIGDSLSLTISVPVGELAIFGHQYHYTLVVYIGATPKIASTEIYVNGPPSATLSATATTFCSGSSILFTGGGGVFYEFLVEGNSLQNLSSTSYFNTSSLHDGDSVQVIVEDVNNCKDTATVVVSVNSLPDLGAPVSLSNPCDNGQGIDIQYTQLSGSGNFTIQFWNSNHTIKYGSDYPTMNQNGYWMNVPVPYGESDFHIRIIDNTTGCVNF